MVKKSTKKDSARSSIDASKKLAEYLKVNKLDPKKDWTNDPKHGKKISEWVRIIRLGEQKVLDKPLKKLKKPEVHPKIKKITKVPTSYDYPDIDGMPMSSDMKKKYRAKMRSLMKSNMEVSKANKLALEHVLNYKGQEPKPKKEESEKPKKAKKEKVKEEPKPTKKVEIKDKSKKVKKAKKEKVED